jgi:phosphate transport system permease protein
LDRPRAAPFDRAGAAERGASAVAALALVWAPFHLIGLNAPLGFVVCWFGAFTTIYGIVVRQRRGALELKDALATVFITAGTVVALLPLGFLLYYLVKLGHQALFAGFPHFLTHDLRNFQPLSPVSNAGMSHAMIGTVEQVGIATAATVPVGILAATYLNEVGGRFASIVRTVADAMTGLPSIIAGLVVYTAWVLGAQHGHYSGLAAAMALSIVMLPTIVRTAEEVLRIVSDSLREAALALGAPEWRTVLQVVIPTARTGLVTAAILGVARAVGETAPVLLTAFGAQRTNVNPLSGPQADLPLQVYLLIRSPRSSNVAVAWGGALLLMIIILTLFSLARILGSGGPGGRTWGPRRTLARLQQAVRGTAGG